jgi:hypothetical protein
MLPGTFWWRIGVGRVVGRVVGNIPDTVWVAGGMSGGLSGMRSSGMTYHISSAADDCAAQFLWKPPACSGRGPLSRAGL